MHIVPQNLLGDPAGDWIRSQVFSRRSISGQVADALNLIQAQSFAGHELRRDVVQPGTNITLAWNALGPVISATSTSPDDSSAVITNREFSARPPLGNFSLYGGTGNSFTKFTGPTTSEKTFTLPNSSDTIATKAVDTGWSVTQTFAACTTSAPSISIPSGTLQTTAAAGGFENDGKALYAAPIASARGALSAVMWTSSESAVSLSNSSVSAQSIFPSATDAITLTAGIKYRFRANIHITNGNTSHTNAFSFGGGATYSRVSYNAQSYRGNSGAIVSGGGYSVWSAVATATTLDGGTTQQGIRIWMEGELVCNGTGTCIPQITFSAGPTGTCQTEAGSFFEIWPVGTSTAESVGPWA
jgi:hypothetical protein